MAALARDTLRAWDFLEQEARDLLTLHQGDQVTARHAETLRAGLDLEVRLPGTLYPIRGCMQILLGRVPDPWFPWTSTTRWEFLAQEWLSLRLGLPCSIHSVPKRLRGEGHLHHDLLDRWTPCLSELMQDEIESARVLWLQLLEVSSELTTIQVSNQYHLHLLLQWTYYATFLQPYPEQKA